MKLIVYSASQSYGQFLAKHLDIEIRSESRLPNPGKDAENIHLLHISSLGKSCFEWMERYASSPGIKIGICSDQPSMIEMLECVQAGCKAYCNSYMAEAHFRQLLQLLENGQSWFPPSMLEQTFKLAHQATRPAGLKTSLDALTKRETEIALAVAEGKSNRQIAGDLLISEPTVKTHLTNIFKKLEVKDRVALVLHLKAS